MADDHAEPEGVIAVEFGGGGDAVGPHGVGAAGSGVGQPRPAADTTDRPVVESRQPRRGIVGGPPDAGGQEHDKEGNDAERSHENLDTESHGCL